MKSSVQTAVLQQFLFKVLGIGTCGEAHPVFGALCFGTGSPFSRPHHLPHRSTHHRTHT
jgi:hypothetical protein